MSPEMGFEGLKTTQVHFLCFILVNDLWASAPAPVACPLLVTTLLSAMNSIPLKP